MGKRQADPPTPKHGQEFDRVRLRIVCKSRHNDPYYDGYFYCQCSDDPDSGDICPNVAAKLGLPT